MREYSFAFFIKMGPAPVYSKQSVIVENVTNSLRDSIQNKMKKGYELHVNQVYLNLVNQKNTVMMETCGEFVVANLVHETNGTSMQICVRVTKLGRN